MTAPCSESPNWMPAKLFFSKPAPMDLTELASGRRADFLKEEGRGVAECAEGLKLIELVSQERNDRSREAALLWWVVQKGKNDIPWVPTDTFIILSALQNNIGCPLSHLMTILNSQWANEGKPTGRAWSFPSSFVGHFSSSYSPPQKDEITSFSGWQNLNGDVFL